MDTIQYVWQHAMASGNAFFCTGSVIWIVFPGQGVPIAVGDAFLDMGTLSGLSGLMYLAYNSVANAYVSVHLTVLKKSDERALKLFYQAQVIIFFLLIVLKWTLVAIYDVYALYLVLIIAEYRLLFIFIHLRVCNVFVCFNHALV